jgi:hypothetical protein
LKLVELEPETSPTKTSRYYVFGSTSKTPTTAASKLAQNALRSNSSTSSLNRVDTPPAKSPNSSGRSKEDASYGGASQTGSVGSGGSRFISLFAALLRGGNSSNHKRGFSSNSSTSNLSDVVVSGIQMIEMRCKLK